ncbi:restriction modification system DNA specificity domain-containing protein [Methanococcus maripaludis X1]|uniref:Restriction modification system DNA specificity domain-containing protein n=1 Tax=Methanococcus maripaludis X1 TaxID=1053692 RepID=G0H483_METMI|nr:restriction endonuclease subunit S [Methanococcus maripaludis]AEK19514.1 restriction modification system DNA specificity domain-containing protein [Methanococcus maripaludis X1]
MIAQKKYSFSEESKSFTYKKYPSYKDSGIEWIGEIPEGWEVQRLKNLISTIQSGNREKGGGNLFDDGIFSVGGEHILWDGTISLKNPKYVSEEFYKSMNNGKLRINDVLLVKDGATIGKTAILIEKHRMAINEHVFLMRPNNKLIPKLLYYLISSDLGFKQIKLTETGSAQGGINLEFTSKIIFAVPSLSEQTKIAEFLDEKTEKIDKIIEKNIELINLLKEKRISLINNAVTKGLDKNVNLKDSGIDWIGEIPEGWEVRKLKDLSNLIIDGTHFTPTYVDKGIPFLRVTDIQSEKIDMGSIKYIPKEEYLKLNLRCNPKKGDLLFSKNGTIGIPKVVDWDFKFSIFVSLCLIKLKEIISVNFLKYYLVSPAIKEQIYVRSKTTSVTNLHLDQIREFFISFPPIQEQTNIAQYLDKETEKIDKIIIKTEKNIELLKEYKTSLIHNAVTGKIDVRGE